MFEQIESLDNLVKAGPVDESDISKYEKELKVFFGEKYKHFLMKFGCLSVEYLEFYGICGENSSAPSAIFVTKKMREDLDFFPGDLIVIHEVGDGTFYCVDSNDRIFFCNYHECNKIDDSFADFLLNKIKEL